LSFRWMGLPRESKLSIVGSGKKGGFETQSESVTQPELSKWKNRQTVDKQTEEWQISGQLNRQTVEWQKRQTVGQLNRHTVEWQKRQTVGQMDEQTDISDNHMERWQTDRTACTDVMRKL
jgi:hypothetical protein